MLLIEELRSHTVLHLDLTPLGSEQAELRDTRDRGQIDTQFLHMSGVSLVVSEQL
jgi:hypothetical protein